MIKCYLNGEGKRKLIFLESKKTVADLLDSIKEDFPLGNYGLFQGSYEVDTSTELSYIATSDESDSLVLQGEIVKIH